jgi:radical SAM protein with 4Fe4S-binding SPASM domain
MVVLNPITFVWEYTLRCNSLCTHCGSEALNARDYELNTKESLDLVDALAEIGFSKGILSGGEPSLRKDWTQIVDQMIVHNMKWGMISNALAWSEKTIEDIVSRQPFAIGFSVDGEQELHDELRGVPGSHKKIFSEMKKLIYNDTPVCAVTTVQKSNLDELSQIRNRLVVYGADAWQIQVASPMGRMLKENTLNHEEYKQLADFIIETREKLPHMNIQAGDCVGYMGPKEKGLRDYDWHGCQSGIQSIGIESDGTIKGCLSMIGGKGVEGNIRKNSLKEIWNNPDNFKYNRDFQLSYLSGECKSCDYGSDCRGGCLSQSLAFFDVFHQSPYCLTRE